MARINIPVTKLDLNGATGIDPEATEVTSVAASDHSFVNDGRTILQIRNTVGTSRTVTIQTPNTVDGLAVANRDVIVATGKTAFVGPFPRSIYNGVDPDLSGDGGTNHDRVLVDVANSDGDVAFRAYRM